MKRVVMKPCVIEDGDGNELSLMVFEDEQVRAEISNSFEWKTAYLVREDIAALRDWCNEWLAQPVPVKPDGGIYASWGAEVIGIEDSGKPRVRLNG